MKKRLLSIVFAMAFVGICQHWSFACAGCAPANAFDLFLRL